MGWALGPTLSQHILFMQSNRRWVPSKQSSVDSVGKMRCAADTNLEAQRGFFFAIVRR